MRNHFDTLRDKEAQENLASVRRENAILQAEINRLKFLFLDALPHKLAHGDEDHRRWLGEAIVAVWNGEPTPKPYGKANWESERDSLREQLRVVTGERDRWAMLTNLAKDFMTHSEDCDVHGLRRCDCGLDNWYEQAEEKSPND